MPNKEQKYAEAKLDLLKAKLSLTELTPNNRDGYAMRYLE